LQPFYLFTWESREVLRHNSSLGMQTVLCIPRLSANYWLSFELSVFYFSSISLNWSMNARIESIIFADMGLLFL
jgi:hypothetical protein